MSYAIFPKWITSQEARRKKKARLSHLRWQIGHLSRFTGQSGSFPRYLDVSRRVQYQAWRKTRRELKKLGNPSFASLSSDTYDSADHFRFLEI